MRLCNILKLLLHILLAKGVKQTNKQSYLTWQSKSAFDLKKLNGQKMMFAIKDFFSICDQILSFLWIWSHLLKKSWDFFSLRLDFH